MCLLLQAKGRGIESARQKMFSGEKINFTEVCTVYSMICIYTCITDIIIACFQKKSVPNLWTISQEIPKQNGQVSQGLKRQYGWTTKIWKNIYGISHNDLWLVWLNIETGLFLQLKHFIFVRTEQFFMWLLETVPIHQLMWMERM